MGLVVRCDDGGQYSFNGLGGKEIVESGLLSRIHACTPDCVPIEIVPIVWKLE